MRLERITSAQNPKIKHLLALQEKSSLRREEGLFVVEGRREFSHALEAGFVPHTIFYCPEMADQVGHDVLAQAVNAAGVMPGSDRASLLVEVPPALYAKIALRGTTEGLVAEMHQRSLSLNDLTLSENPLIVVLESVEKPGNLGAILRSADAAGADAVIVADPLTDLYNPNLIRASIGAVFTVPTVACSGAEAIDFLKKSGVQILTAQLQDSAPYYDVDMTRGTAIVMGTESTGLSDLWRLSATSHILIPMLGRLDSLNVSVSAAILLYEAVRQRRQ
ncbi:MAG: RNA methyltransferase [Bacteroidales bacterium]|nr:RNA methyltransferase [Bacteroidales bacterium]